MCHESLEASSHPIRVIIYPKPYRRGRRGLIILRPRFTCLRYNDAGQSRRFTEHESTAANEAITLACGDEDFRLGYTD